MHFCKKCDNMYYIKVSENGSDLIHYCRNCGNEDKTISSKDISISKMEFSKQEHKYDIHINEYTKLDPTIPRINGIKCINPDCVCNTDEGIPQDILYVRLNEDDLTYIYSCTHCDTSWETN